ncbi:AraC family transcriptional regulator [Dickeya lacustris]|uniref:Arabinose operon regulatory protein n=1 Tax=Dickeya lacustris TaxID=2259638 RepID=A0ABY8G9T4_9GAMM|nr:AraC family transcriptional regulator [Dickeya lacustris]WFN56735.1 AraC family transcriptional regulator [Dickeya lacustris]
MGTSSSREEVQFHHLKELGGLEMLQARYHRQRFARHSHENFCVGVIEEGAQRFYRTGGEHVAPTGDIILVNADDIHTGHADVPGGWAYRAIYPSPALLCHLSRDLRIPQGSTPWFPDAVVHDPGLSAQLRLAFTLLSQADNSLFKETLLFSSLSWLMMRYSKTPADGRALAQATPAILRAKRWLDECPEQDTSLLQLAQMAGLSPWHFLRQFKSLIGMPPHAYLIQARLRQARSLLINGVSLSDVASRCGFSDQSHFNRHFKRAIGITPGEFVRTLK